MGFAISILRDVRRRSQVDWYVMEGVAGTSRYHQAVIARLHLARLEQQVGCPVESSRSRRRRASRSVSGNGTPLT